VNALSRNLVFKACLVCLLLLAGTEMLLGLAKNHSLFFELFNQQIPSREILTDLLAVRRPASRPLVVVMGDSVVYGSGLHAHGVRHWREQTIAAFLQKQLPQYTVLDLSLDGALPGDYLALYAAVRKLKPAWMVLEFNYRMFSQKYQAQADALSRPWLNEVWPNPMFPKPKLTAGDKIANFLRKYSLLYRYAEAFRNAVFFPSREEVFNGLIQTLLPARSLQDPGDKELLLKLKLKPYYYTPVLVPAHTALQAGSLLIQRLGEDQQPYLAFFTPQNLDFIEEIADPASFSRNLSICDLALGSRTVARGSGYFNWFNLYPAAAFYDHCHLEPKYNENLAKKLAETMLNWPAPGRGEIASGVFCAGQENHARKLE
jgi:hypothetical protein